MKTTKKTLWKLLLICAAMFLSVGSTIAYLTDSDADVNVMTLGRVEIDLIEQERVPGGLDVFHDDHPLIPGVYPENTVTGGEKDFWPDSVHNAVDKIVKVQNTGNTDAYVRLWFAFEVTGEDNFFQDKIHLNKNATDWEWASVPGVLNQDGAKYVVAVATYPQVLPKGETTPVSLRQVLLDSSATNEHVAALGEKYSILVVAQGVQASGFTSPEQALTSGFGEVKIGNHPFKGMNSGESYVTVNMAGLNKVLDNKQMGGKESVVGVTFGRTSEYDVLMEGINDYTPVQEAQSTTSTRPVLFATACAEDESGVTAYYVKAGEEDGKTLYHVYILAEGEIKLHKDCETLMGDFGKLTVFAATNLDASDVKQMQNFYKGCTNLTVVTVPDGTTEITVKMFEDCDNLTYVEFPESVQKVEINPNAFNDKKENVYLIVVPGSDAEQWGKDEGYKTTNWPFIWRNMGDYIHIEKYIGTASEVVVPAEIEGLPVEVLGVNAFAALEHMDIVTSVQLPETLRRADYGVFIDCNNLRTINIPASLTRIPQDFLCMCKSLESITIPAGVIKIESGAFLACEKLKSVSIPNTVTYIGYDAFSSCYSLESITLPNSVTHIGANAFMDTPITRLTLPNSVTWLGDSALAGMKNLKELTIPASVQHFGTNCIPSGVTIRVESGSKAEQYCKDNDLTYTLTDGTVVDPSQPAVSPETPDVNPGDAGSFVAREMVGKIILIDGYNDEEAPLVDLIVPKWLNNCRVRVIGTGAFASRRHLRTVTLPDGLWEIKPTAFASSQKLTTVTIPDSVNNIGRDAFSSCSKLVKVNIPTGITSLNDGVFRGCSSLEKITIPGNVLYIEREAFAYCSSMKKVTIQEGVTSLSAKVFAGCTNLLDVNIPRSVTSIGKGVFDNCPLVQVDVYQNTAGHRYCVDNGIPYNLYAADGTLIQSAGPRPDPAPMPEPEKPSEDFEWHDWTDEVPFTWYRMNNEIFVGQYEGVGPEVEFPAELGGLPVKVLRLNTFAGMKYIKKVTLPDTLTTIEGWVFPGANNMTECNIPAGVTSIGDGAFFECYALKSVTIPTGVTEILESTFGWCKSLTSVTIPGNVKTIHQQAFHDCIGLTSIVIEDGVETIGAEAFAGCKSLTSITIPASVTKMDPNVFKDCGDQVVATVYLNSTAYTYCKENGIRCKVLNADGSVEDEPSEPDSGEGGDSGDADVSKADILPTEEFPFYATKWGNINVELIKYDAASNKNQASVTIPETYQDVPIMTVQTAAFKGDSNLETVNIPKNVTYIGANAFENCSKLKSITLPGGVINGIGERAFANCTSLTSVTLCATEIQNIGNAAFTGCTNLEQFILYAHSMEMSPAYFDPSIYDQDSKFTIYAPKGSDAETWCGKNEINFSPLTTN